MKIYIMRIRKADGTISRDLKGVIASGLLLSETHNCIFLHCLFGVFIIPISFASSSTEAETRMYSWEISTLVGMKDIIYEFEKEKKEEVLASLSLSLSPELSSS